MTAATELEVRAAQPIDPATAAAIGDAVLTRIHELVGYRRWYAEHAGWLVTTHTEHMEELRYLLRLRREGRRLYEAVPDPVTASKAATDRLSGAARERDRWITTESELRLLDGNR